MEEKELKSLWKNTNKGADHYYQEIGPEVLTKAKKNSHDILNQVRKNIIIELVISAICTVVFPLAMLQQDAWKLIVGTVLIVFAMVFTLKEYLGYLKKMKRVNESDIKSALNTRIQILGGWIRRLKRLIYIFTPIGYFFGLAVGMEESGGDLSTSYFLVKIAFAAPFLLLFVWFINKYLYWLYGKNLKKLEEIYDGLEKES